MRSVLRHMPRRVRRLGAALIGAQVLLTACYWGFSRGWPGFRQFNMDGELNVPTWWSSLILIATAGACFGLWWTTARLGRRSGQWLAIAIGFLGLSLEEVASIHEDIGSSVGGGSDHVSIWPLLYAPLVVLGIWMLVRAVRDLPRPIATMALLGLVAYVGVLSIELLSLLGESNTTIAIEENLEMLGTGLMLCALASELTTRFLALFPEAARAPERASLVAGRR